MIGLVKWLYGWIIISFSWKLEEWGEKRKKKEDEKEV